MANSVSLPGDALKTIFKFLTYSEMSQLKVTNGQFAGLLVPMWKARHEKTLKWIEELGKGVSEYLGSDAGKQMMADIDDLFRDMGPVEYDVDDDLV